MTLALTLALTLSLTLAPAPSALAQTPDRADHDQRRAALRRARRRAHSRSPASRPPGASSTPSSSCRAAAASTSSTSSASMRTSTGSRMVPAVVAGGGARRAGHRGPLLRVAFDPARHVSATTTSARPSPARCSAAPRCCSGPTVTAGATRSTARAAGCSCPTASRSSRATSRPPAAAPTGTRRCSSRPARAPTCSPSPTPTTRCRRCTAGRCAFTRDEFDAILAEGRTLAATVPVARVERLGPADDPKAEVRVTGQDGTSVTVRAIVLRDFLSTRAVAHFPDRFPVAAS